MGGIEIYLMDEVEMAAGSMVGEGVVLFGILGPISS